MGNTFQTKQTEVQSYEILRKHSILEAYIFFNGRNYLEGKIAKVGGSFGKTPRLLLGSIVYSKKNCINKFVNDLIVCIFIKISSGKLTFSVFEIFLS
jgi:hypothetical protein